MPHMQDTLQANQLGAWPASFADTRILSLDCFDTLLWRKVAAPTDVFFALEKTEEYRRAGLTASLRVSAEKSARQARVITGKGSEVTLEQIYRFALPEATADEVAALAACELACEIAHCFVFQPVFDLIVRARAAGLKVVIVSDTYFSEAQLRALLFAAMPELEAMIDGVFCSSVLGLSKSAGIWRLLLPRLKTDPAQILHLGDNERADLQSPRRFGIRSAHLIQQDAQVADMLAAREQAAVQVLPDVRYRDPLPSHFHAQYAAGAGGDVRDTFGYVAMGPILYGFAEFILAEAAALAAPGRAVKLGFLLRDGFLPARACAVLAGEPVGAELNISRFTAIAASLDSKDRVVWVLSRMLSEEAMESLTRQLLLPPALAQRILGEATRAAAPTMAFAALVLEDATLDVIRSRSRAFRRRLVAHVQQATGVQRGDTLLFVDLGYACTAQTLLKEVLEQDLGVDLVGRYLIAYRAAPGQADRKALIDGSEQDRRVLQSLTGQYIAGFEMLCTQNAPSTVDYTDDGAPVFAQAALGEAQHAAVAAIQAACLRFIADAGALAPCHKPRATHAERAQSAIIDLTRMLYFPSPLEIACMESFRFDFNLGTEHQLALFDAEAGLRDMRRQGFGYMNASLDQMRTNYATELRQLDLSLSTLLFAQNRFGFDVTPAQASYRSEAVQVLVTNAREHVVREMAAHATHDGYFALHLPLRAGMDLGVLFGQAYTFVQIDSVQLVEAGSEAGVDMDPGRAVLFDQMAHLDNGLFQAAGGAMMYLPGLPEYVAPGLRCRVVFRPIARAAAEGAAAVAASTAAAAEAPVLAQAPVPVPVPADEDAFAGFHDLCVLSCYGTADPGILAFLNGLHRALAARGICLLVLTTQSHPELEPLSLEIPYLLSGFDQALDDGVVSRTLHPLLANFLSEDIHAEGSQDAQVVVRGISKCEAFYAALGRTVAPCAGLLWNTTLPHGRIARNTLAAAGVPAYCVERGWLARTFQLHTFENNAYNDFFTDFALNRSLPALLEAYSEQAEPYDTAQRYYREQGIQKYDAGERQASAELRRKYGVGERMLVVCFCASAGSSVGPHDMPSMAYTSPYFESITDALSLLAELLAPYPEVCVLVQEHPIQRAINKSATLPPGFVLTSGENIHTLLDAADRLVFIGSTTVQAEALLRDTPRLSMSRHPASHAGASYGLVEEGSEAVAAWMDDTRKTETAAAARGLVNYLCREQLIRDEGLPDFVQRDVGDLADFIAGLSRPSRSTVAERLQQFFVEAEGMLRQHPHP